MDANSAVDEYNPTQIDIDTLSGNAASHVNRFRGMTYECCETITVENPNVYAYGHTGGIALANGDKLWISLQCPQCGYDLNHKSWESHLQ